MSLDLRRKAERFVSKFYAVNIQTARDFFNDEIEAYMRLLEMELNRTLYGEENEL